MSDTPMPDATGTGPVSRDTIRGLASSWWLFLALGVLWILFGMFVLSYNVGSLLALAVFAGVTFLMTGVTQVLGASRVESWQWLYLLGGVLSILAGIVAFAWPGRTLLVLAGIGWGKPVPVNVAALRPGRTGIALVAAAGPVANLLVALGLALIYRAADLAGTGGAVLQLVYVATVINLLLAILNLIPIPPLDGFGVLTALVPPRWEYSIRRYQGYGVVLLLLLLILPNSPLSGVLGLAYPWAALLCGL